MDDTNTCLTSNNSSEGKNIVDSKLERLELPGIKKNKDEKKFGEGILKDDSPSSANTENGIFNDSAKEGEELNDLTSKLKLESDTTNTCKNEAQDVKKVPVTVKKACRDPTMLHYGVNKGGATSRTSKESTSKRDFERKLADKNRRRCIDQSNWRKKSDQPTKVMDEPYQCFYYPSNPMEKDLNLQGGKWLLFGKYMGGEMDAYWNSLIRLCDEEAAIVGLKMSKGGNGAIMVYNEDFSNKQVVKRLAERILETTGYKQYLFYKTNEASVKGMYKRYGTEHVSLYEHDGTDFYFWDGIEWIKWP